MKIVRSSPFLAASAALLLSSCSQQAAPEGLGRDGSRLLLPVAEGQAGADAAGHARVAGVIASGGRMGVPSAPAIAGLADRGELVEYSNVRRSREAGKYRFHPVDVSEAHAFAAIGGTLRLRAPDGSPIDLGYERHVEHPSGDWSWVGRDANGVDAILTFGEKAVFGVLAAAGGESLRLTTNAGRVWMVEQDPRMESTLERNIREGRIGPDYRVPEVRAAALAPGVLEEGADLVRAAAGATPAAAGDPTIDLLLGYTPGFVNMMGGASQAQTRLNHLVTVGNQALVNSQVAANLRLVGTMQVSYTDGGSNDSALNQLTGSTGSSPVTVPASLRPLREERDRVGADLVSLVRRFDNAEHEGCGVAWLLGGGRNPIVPGHEAFGYSVISDSNGTLGADGGHYCRDETLMHELGHNLGSAHDEETATGEGGVSYGRYDYSFGYKASAAGGNFYTVMAYGDAGQTAYRVFSNPQVSTCGGRACGVANKADNARSLRQTIPLIAAFREAVGQGRVRNDFNGDGVSDVLWRHFGDGRNTIWYGGDSDNRLALATQSNTAWQVVGSGDLDGDGRADIVWRHPSSGRNVVWYGGNRSSRLELTSVSPAAWQVVGVGDFNGDGAEDLLWRHSGNGGNRIWLSGSRATRLPISDVGADWKVAGVGDFNGDGRADILWRHARNGKNTIWLSGDRSTRVPLAAVSDVAWQVGAVGDFDGDGFEDIFWRHSGDGRTVLWPAGDRSRRQETGRVSDLQWRVVGSGDFDGDGQADVLWRHRGNGKNLIWRSADRPAKITMKTLKDQGWRVVP